MCVDYKIVEFFNGHNTDKAHPFIEDCISKQQPFVKVIVLCLQESILYSQLLLCTSGSYDWAL